MSALKKIQFVKSSFILMTLVLCFFQSQSAFNQSLNQPLPNLRWISLSFSPNPAYQNGDINLMGSVKNDGMASTGREFHINFYLAEAATPNIPNYNLYLLTIEMSELVAGQTKNFSEIGKVPLDTPPGYYYVWGGLDPLHKITESNEDDNTTHTVAQVHVMPTTTPYIIVTSPNGGEICNVGVTYNITWSSNLTSGYVNIDYSINNGSSWMPIISNTSDDGIHAWAVLNTPSSNCLVKVTDVDGDPSDKSDNEFTIRAIVQPDIAVTPSSWDYGSINIADYSNKTFVVKNEGNANLIVTATNLTGTNVSEFSIQSGGGSFTLTQGATRNLVVRFSPTSRGNKTVTLSISSNDPDENPLLINLIGNCPPPQWKVPIAINGGGTTITRTFGGDASATNGYDAILDIPAAPPGMTYYAYFELNVFPNYLDTDIRSWVAPYQTDIDWTLKILNATGVTSSLSWNPAALPTTGHFFLVSSGFNVDMRTQSSAHVIGNDNLTIQYRYHPTPVTYTFPQAGWYLISLPVTPPNNSLDVIFPTAIAAFAYNSATGSYYAVTTLETKKGYWLLIPAATSSTIQGTPLTMFTEHYAVGWHLIGSVKGVVDFTSPKDNPNGSVIAAYGYKSATGQYYQVYPPGTGVLNEKQGYWLAVSKTCDLTIGGTAIAKTSIAAHEDLEAFYNQFGMKPPEPPFIADQGIAQLLPTKTLISRNYPNPFNPETVIEYTLPKSGLTQVYIYNALGQRIRTLYDALQQAGTHQIVWNGRNDSGELVTNGVYFYKIISPELMETQKMLLLR